MIKEAKLWMIYFYDFAGQPDLWSYSWEKRTGRIEQVNSGNLKALQENDNRYTKLEYEKENIKRW